MPFNEQFVKCTKCTNQVPSAYLDSRGICINCRTRGKSSDWSMREQKRLERQQPVARGPVCENCNRPKKDEGFCRNCGK